MRVSLTTSVAPGCNRAFQKEATSYLSGEKNIQM